MFILFPHKLFKIITDIPYSYFKTLGIDTIILDVDNTLTTHDNPVPADGVCQWLRNMESHGLKLVILSNNSQSRVLPFAQLLHLDFVPDAHKPLTGGFRRVFKKLNTTAKQSAVIGDQLFTDILGGRLAGTHTILVRFIEPETTLFFRFKRVLEKAVMKFYHY